MVHSSYQEENGTIFVSYRHHQGEWVWMRLVPALEAGGVEVIIDRDQFRAGKGVVGQMDHQQDQAEATLAVLTPQYLDSVYCMHELERGFRKHKVIPVVQADCAIPEMIEKPDPLLRIDLQEPEDPYAWGECVWGAGMDTGDQPCSAVPGARTIGELGFPRHAPLEAFTPACSAEDRQLGRSGLGGSVGYDAAESGETDPR